MQWTIDLVLIGLLIATLLYAARLERALGSLRRDRAGLADLVAGFDSSTRQAGSGLEQLRAAADGAGRLIARQVEAGAALKDDLVFLIERGERLADRLDAGVRAGRNAESASPPQSYAAPAYGAGPHAPEPELAGAPVRSQAERDLLRALRGAR